MKAKTMSTTPVIALFMIISITGVFLLLHIGSGSMKTIHEWLGLAFVVFGLLHAGANWHLMKRYFGGLRGAAIGLILAVTLGYSVLSPSSEHGGPDRAIFGLVMRAPLTTVASLYGQEVNSLAEQLQAKGYIIASVDNTLEEIAAQNNTRAFEVMNALAENTTQRAK
ncbi:DUF4405 domain-containing protein [Desulfopila aestuarii]|uniref:Flavinylation-associated cytochrome domain-containing protein n=1 Tax=Desulfopila aestuarii DSM 18488 TaxID=1121416 RepID=A0A1M7Y3H8_9BACT|nr:DUF4405 domain-containing protein [Desulfopila aestuarii]SHO46428.1 protein of unknown function [Desulfopila aestuarii DSM 18488]